MAGRNKNNNNKADNGLLGGMESVSNNPAKHINLIKANPLSQIKERKEQESQAINWLQTSAFRLRKRWPNHLSAIVPAQRPYLRLSGGGDFQ